MSKMKIETYILPAMWASYLINADPSGLEQSDIVVCDRWMEYQGLNAPVGVGEQSEFCTYHDAYPDVLACDCAEYTFEKQ